MSDNRLAQLVGSSYRRLPFPPVTYDHRAAYERRNQDVGNIVHLEHVNVWIPDQSLATLFYIVGLGFTRDPYLMVGLENMWVNLGKSQFHLPSGDPQNFRGVAGLVVPDLDALPARLRSIERPLAGTRFAWALEDKHVSVTCPWGNRFRCYAAGPQFGDMTLGMAYVEWSVAPGDAEGIARFYGEVFGAVTSVTPNGGATARVKVGVNQELVFRETTEPLTPWDGHHIQVYIADFAGPHRWLKERDLVSEESMEWQYRFKDIVDPATGRRLFELEHEVRSVTHPLYARPLVNRNAAQRQATYQPGRDAYIPGM